MKLSAPTRRVLDSIGFFLFGTPLTNQWMLDAMEEEYQQQLLDYPEDEIVTEENWW